MSKKDANSFLKAVKKFGRIERMADIAEEVGSVLKDQSAPSRSSFSRSILCRNQLTELPVIDYIVNAFFIMLACDQTTLLPSKVEVAVECPFD